MNSCILFVASVGLLVTTAGILGGCAGGPTQPNARRVLITQSWDDGDRNDERLIAVLRKYNARGTFFIYPVNYVLLSKDPQAALKADPRLIAPLSRFLEVYGGHEGLEIGAHGYTHPDLRKCSPEQLRYELAEPKRVLEAWFARPVVGMSYPYGACDATVIEAVRAAGYRYARVVSNPNQPPPDVLPVEDPYRLPPSLHFRDPRFWDQFERVKTFGGAFYFWGHSSEIRTEEQWRQFEQTIARLSADPAVQWVTNAELLEMSAAPDNITWRN